MAITRRGVLRGAAAVSATLGLESFWVAQAATSGSEYAPVNAELDQFAERYLRENSIPGMTLVLADRAGVQRVASYGFGDLQSRRPVQDHELFQIGSISKSFIAACLMQLHEEGKLDLHKPLQDYLPWLPIDSDFAPITAHHLLTHSGGLVGYGDLFQSDPTYRHRAAYPPGERFNYSNMGFDVLGYLAWTLDGRRLSQLLRERMFVPAGMRQAEPVITYEIRDRLVKSYVGLRTDRPVPTTGPVCEASGMFYTSAAGCIASSARDMGTYIQMIARRGQGPKGKVLSEQAFDQWTTGRIAATSYGPKAQYGYGWVVDQLDGHRLLFHPGRMYSFVSYLGVDVDAGLGAFASINSLGPAPAAVVKYACQLMRSVRERRPAAPPPKLPEPWWQEQKAAEYAGTFRHADGELLQVIAENDRLYLVRGTQRTPMESLGKDKFLASQTGLDHYTMLFGRKDPARADSPVVEIGWGERWYVNSAYDGPKTFTADPKWNAYVGHYNDNGAMSRSVRIVVRKGRLWVDGTTPLKEVDGGFVSEGSEPWAEPMRFGQVINGCCERLRTAGRDYFRVDAA
ncbi:MAG: serine hydrolase [Steroidobacter sp.]|nr:serine hydrolase [Steroidobacter sp.]